MSEQHNNKFSLPIRRALLDRNWSVAELARRIQRPRQTVSSSIYHPEKFPRVRTLVIQALSL